MKGNDKAFINRAILEDYRTYLIEIAGYLETFLLFCSPDSEEYIKLNLKNNSTINIGSDSKNDIIYKNRYVGSIHASVSINNGKVLIKSYDKNFGTYVNNSKVSQKPKNISNGDSIFIIGLKIIVLGNSIYINNPLNRMTYNEKKLSLDNNYYLEKMALPKSENTDLKIYKDKDYFSKVPRIKNIIEEEEIKIDEPPQSQNKNDLPTILVLGPTITMGIMMVFSMMSSLSLMFRGEGNYGSGLLLIGVTFLMLIGMIVFPIATNKYESNRKRKNEIIRQEKYKKYISSKENILKDIAGKQERIINENIIPVEECNEIILEKDVRLWERQVTDEDFLAVRLGIGELPLDIKIKFAEEKFTLEEDNLFEMVTDLVDKSSTKKKLPLSFSFIEHNASAIISENEKLLVNYMNSILLQLITFQSPEDLKIVFFTNKEKINNWRYIKYLPHLFNNTKEIRFFADNLDEIRDISSFIEEEFKAREKSKKENKDISFIPHYIIISDDMKTLENISMIKEIFKDNINYGFSLLCLSDNLYKLPKECNTFIKINEKGGELFESAITSNSRQNFLLDEPIKINYNIISKKLMNLPIKYKTEAQSSLPNTYSFLEMYNVGRIEGLNILERWSRNDATLSLEAPIGIDNSGMPIVLDIHEKKHGPHGLIAGSTGSGKSEFLITYILSLAVNYSPEYVAFLLIDYKGGGSSGAFQKGDTVLPHIVGTITNLDKMELQRALDSIKSELRRRQTIFNVIRNNINESTIDIYKYQKLYKEKVVNEPLPHLIIICDEFAELKQQHEEVMDEIISVSRIGRSLGIHLILATQKPSGIINDQIRSNSRFAISLKVQSVSDSHDVIGKPDAAYLKKTGQFCMQIGSDEYYVVGESAWTGVKYIPTEFVKKEVDTSIEFISNTGNIIKRVNIDNNEQVYDYGDQLTNIVKYISKIAKSKKISSERLWLENIPSEIFLDELREKYNVSKKKNVIEPLIGEFDDPVNQRQGPILLNILEMGNTIIYGNAESGKETFLSTLIFDLSITHTAKEVQVYIVDFGSEALKVFRESPIVGDVVLASDEEKIDRLFTMLMEEIAERKEILSKYNGDYKIYLKNEECNIPMKIIIINNYAAYSEIYENKYEEYMQVLVRDGLNAGIAFIITANTSHDLRYRLQQNFKQKIALQLNNDDEYLNIIEGIKRKRPSHIFGRGIIKVNNNIYEFQTAKICQDNDFYNYVRETMKVLSDKLEYSASPIPVLPEVVSVSNISEEIKGLSHVPIGIYKNNLQVCTYDFKRSFLNIIISKNIYDIVRFSNSFLDILSLDKKINICLIDMSQQYLYEKVDLERKLKAFDERIDNFDDNLLIVIGIEKFLNEAMSIGMDISEKFTIWQESRKCNVLFAESINKLKNHQYDDWYKNYVSEDAGIWIGKGVTEQFVISLNNRNVDENIDSTFGYVINNENPQLIKLIGMDKKEMNNG